MIVNVFSRAIVIEYGAFAGYLQDMKLSQDVKMGLCGYGMFLG